MTKGHVLVRNPIRLVPIIMKMIERQVNNNLLRGGGKGGGGVGISSEYTRLHSEHI
jgi:hypothetical protein